MIDCHDNLLVHRFKEGDQRAFTAIVQKYKIKAFRIVYNLVRNVDDAKELSQDAFVKVYASINQFKGGSSFYTWFYRILINVCLDYKRKRRLMQIPFSQLGKGNEWGEVCLLDTIEDQEADNPLKILIAGELNQRITCAIDSLSEKQKIAFILRHYEHLSLKEIAEITESSEGTIKSHLARAVKKLQCLLKNKSQPTVQIGRNANE